MAELPEAESCGWTWVHRFGGSVPRYCELPFDHDEDHRLCNELGSVIATAPAGYRKEEYR